MSTDPATVLVVDDELTMLSLMSSILEDSGRFTVSRAQDGEQALARIESDAPDLMITDLRMPRLSGEALTSRALALRPDYVAPPPAELVRRTVETLVATRWGKAAA